jgi:simple sugar transport system permease protein
VHALFLALALGLAALAVWWLYRRRTVQATIALLAAAGSLALYLFTDSVPQQFTQTTPYVTTLLVLALATQRLRMPKADGVPYRRGTAS